MNVSTLLTTTAAAQTGGIGESILTVIVGFSFVLLILVTLTLATTLIGRVAGNPEIRRQRRKARAAAPAPVPVSPEPGIDPKVIAAITAAVRYAIGNRPHRLTGIRSGTGGWAQEGRRQIFSSHRLR